MTEFWRFVDWVCHAERKLFSFRFSTHTLTLEFKAADLWVGIFPRLNRRITDRRDRLVVGGKCEQMTILDVWLVIIPTLPLHFTFKFYDAKDSRYMIGYDPAGPVDFGALVMLSQQPDGSMKVEQVKQLPARG